MEGAATGVRCGVDGSRLSPSCLPSVETGKAHVVFNDTKVIIVDKAFEQAAYTRGNLPSSGMKTSFKYSRKASR